MSEQHIDILDEREQAEDAALETFLKELKWQEIPILQSLNHIFQQC